MIVIYEDGTLERTQCGEQPDCEGHARLLQWMRDQQIPIECPDYHRCQLEFWVWSRLQPTPSDRRILDIGAYTRRDYLGPQYRTFGFADTAPDLVGDLLVDDLGGPWDVILLTEVLEHCADPALAIARCRDALAPEGLVLATSPFLWPDHRTEQYPDYWRFTEQGWRWLFRAWREVVVTPIAWTRNGAAAYHLLRDAEGWGLSRLVRGVTGYLVEARP